MPAFDDTIQAISGMAAYQEVYSSQPSYTSGATADKVTGIMLGMSILGALFNREKNGTGAEIEVPMMETMVDLHLLNIFMVLTLYKSSTSLSNNHHLIEGHIRPRMVCCSTSL